MTILDRKSPARLMTAFDRLPEPVRRAVAEARLFGDDVEGGGDG